MKRSDLNHLRRLVAWARCEIGQSPDELVTTMRNLAERGITIELHPSLTTKQAGNHGNKQHS